MFEQIANINFDPIFEKSVNFGPIFEKSVNFGPIFEKMQISVLILVKSVNF